MLPGIKEAKTRLEEEMRGKEHKVVMKVEERISDKRPEGMVVDRGAKAC